MCPCCHTKQTKLSLLRYQRIAARRGGKRALIAVSHTMLTAIYHILKEKVPYHDLGADYYSVINQEKLIRRTLHALEKSGMDSG